MRLALLALVSLATAAAQTYNPPRVCRTRLHEPVSITYAHPLTGLERTIRVAVEEPLDAAGPLPAVVWMHGGAGGGTPKNLAGWRGDTAGACYLSATIGHHWPEPAQAKALCEWMGRDYPSDCGEARRGQVKLLNVERPFDLRAALDYLLEEWDERVDPERIAVGGHSAGAGATLMVAGAERSYEEQVGRFADPRPRAFLAFSPQGPGTDGFSERAWSEIERPVLIGTGAGDSTSEPASNRVKAFEGLPGPDQYLLYIRDESAPHGRFGLGRARCASTGGNIPDADCDRVIGWLGSTAVAFLDAHLRQDQAAQAWLRGDALERATGGVARLTVK